MSPSAATAESRSLDVFDNFPGFRKATLFLQDQIQKNNSRIVGDIGGGANPLLDSSYIGKHNIDYRLLDISHEELEKAPGHYHKIQVNVMAEPEEFRSAVGTDQFDLIFSHMFFEHISRPEIAHANIYSALKPGGIAIHFFPSHWNIPLFVNKISPEFITHKLVRLLQPGRDISGKQGKFPAYYAMCSPPSSKQTTKLTAIGYEIDSYTGFIGHEYYEKLPVIRNIERNLRPFLQRFKIPLTSFILLVLRKPI